LFDEGSNRLRLRYVHCVVGFNLYNGCAGAFGHHPLSIRRDHLVFGGEYEPTGLCFPRRFSDRTGWTLCAPRDLGIRHERGRVRIYVCGECRPKFGLVKEQESVLRWQNRGLRIAWLWIRNQRVYRLSLVGSEGRYIHESGNLRVIACFSDHCTAIRVANQDNGAALVGNYSPSRCDIVAEGNGRILNDGDRVTVLFQD